MEAGLNAVVIPGRGEVLTVPRDYTVMIDYAHNGESLKKILENLGIKTVFEGQTLKCFAPAYRRDLESDCDIIEEIIRVYGYDKIVSSYLENTVPTYGGKTSAQELCDRVKNIAVGLGYNQITTYSFGASNFSTKRFRTETPTAKNVSK